MKHFVSFNLTTTKIDSKEMGLFPKHLMVGERKKAPARVGICLPEGVFTQFYRMKLKTRHEND